MTGVEMRKLALAMPDAEEKSHFGNPDFRVNNHIFAGMSADGKRGTLKLTPEIQSTVLDAKPGAFAPCEGTWGRRGWTYVTLAKVDRAELAGLIEEAWRLVAPKRAVAARANAASTPNPKAKAKAKPKAKANAKARRRA